MLKLLITLFSIFPFLAKASIASDIIHTASLVDTSHALNSFVKMALIHYGQKNIKSTDMQEYIESSRELCTLIISLYKAIPKDIIDAKKSRIERQKYLQDFSSIDLIIYNRLALYMMCLETIEIMAEDAKNREIPLYSSIDLGFIRTLIEYLDTLIENEIKYPIDADLFKVDEPNFNIMGGLSLLESEDKSSAAPIQTKPTIEKPILKNKAPASTFKPKGNISKKQEKRKKHSRR